MKKNRTEKRWSIVLDHAAIAVKAPEKLERVLEVLGVGSCGEEEVPSQKILTRFFKPGPSQPMIEVLVPNDTSSTVASFIEKKGGGIHHLSFQVSDLDAVEQALREQNVRLVYECPQPGAHSLRVNFIHPESTGGVLIEISGK